ncbi:DUF4340 domain-containing protein [Pseudodesulfovibrio sp. zrk46]|uniref:DUF4340 domain-containing protein n=1 Tax=Pseudodesulfovibrio sp. zrk46 TaxID=2725288 RepID=UPI00144A2544|nr:DUF4340 domain-containing protein [Pseudodesulfovibrio sp. zrk46]QJB57942.1 DUF4340 domain-containing protein [Pseudodesulfovibrio sp. zrk46]
MKRLSFVLTIVLLGVIAGVGYWYTTLNKEEFDHSRWLSNSFDNVRSIHVQGKMGSFMLSGEKGDWEAQVPGASWNVTARALSAKVMDYLGKLAALEPHRSTGGFDRGGPEQYGLDNPDLKIIVTFGAENVEPLTVKLTSDGAGTIYGWNSRSKGLVYEFAQKALDSLALPATNFLDRKVFNFDQEDVAKVQLLQPFGSSWLVEKRKEGFFFSLPGYLKDKPASDSALKLYIHSLALLKAGNLVLEPVVTEKRLPVLTVKVWAGKETEPGLVNFFTIKDSPDQYLGKSSWLTVPFTLDAQSVSQLVKSAFDVQGRSVVKLDLGDVGRFLVMHGDASYVVERGETGWRLLDGKKDLQGIDMFLWRFTELQFEALPLNNLPATALKLMYCKLMDKDGDKLTELTFYADPKLPQGQCWMKNGGGMYYPVSSRLLKDLQGMFPTNAPANGPGA